MLPVIRQLWSKLRFFHSYIYSLVPFFAQNLRYTAVVEWLQTSFIEEFELFIDLLPVSFSIAWKSFMIIFKSLQWSSSNGTCKCLTGDSEWLKCWPQIQSIIFFANRKSSSSCRWFRGVVVLLLTLRLVVHFGHLWLMILLCILIGIWAHTVQNRSSLLLSRQTRTRRPYQMFPHLFMSTHVKLENSRSHVEKGRWNSW